MDGLGPLEPLDLAFLVHAQDDRVIRWIEMSPRVARSFFDVGRELDGPGAVRLDPEKLQMALHCRLRDSGGLVRTGTVQCVPTPGRLCNTIAGRLATASSS